MSSAREPSPRVWAEAFAATRAILIAQGCQPHVADDHAQEAVVRAWAEGIPFDSLDDLVPWCATVAKRLRIDEHRRYSGRVIPTEADLEAPGTAYDVAEVVAHRQHLRSALGAIRTGLSNAEQQAIARHLVDDPEPVARAMQNTVNVSMFRGRRRLRAIVGGPVAAALGALLRPWRQPRASAAALACTAFALALVLTPLVVPGDDDGVRRPPSPPAGSGAGAADGVLLRTPSPSATLTAVGSRPAGPTRPSGPVPTPTRYVDARGPAGSLVYVERRPATPEDHLICTGGSGTGPLDPDICLDAPATLPPLTSLVP